MLRQKNKGQQPNEKDKDKDREKGESESKSQKPREEMEASMLEYNVQKLLTESAEREERYINFIKDQKEQLFAVTERYSEVMSRYEKEIKEFISKKQAQKQAKIFERVHRMATKLPPNQYNKQEYTSESEYELQCRITFKFFIPMLQDYLRETFPSKFSIEFGQYYPNREQKVFPVQFSPQLDQEEVIENIRNGYSFDLFSPDMTPPTYNFVISHFGSRWPAAKVLGYFKQGQLQFLVRNQATQLVLGYGKVDLEQLLQFNPQHEDSWVEKVPIVGLDVPDSIVAFLCVELGNQATPRRIPQQHRHKISQPIALNRQQAKIYNDRQSRLLQRINQYKNLHQSIIPGQAREADKNILMHQKRKELEQIEHYKEVTKNDYMDKVFGEAIEQYHTDTLEAGECKYVHFVYSNHTEHHQKAKITLTHHLLKDEQAKSEQQPEDAISVEMLDPAAVLGLIQEQILSLPSKVDNCNFEFSLDNGYVFVVIGESILVYVKVICHSLASLKYQLNFQLANDFGEMLHSDMVILRTSEPVPTHIFPLYTFPSELNHIKVQVPSYVAVREGFSQVGRAKIANIIGADSLFQFDCHWAENYEILELKVVAQPKAAIGKVYHVYMFVYDMGYTVELACFQFMIECVEKIEDQNIELGRTNTFAFKLKFPPADTAGQKMLVRLGSSDYLEGTCTLFNTTLKAKQFVAEPNMQYPITLNYNTFTQHPPADKLIISCINTTTNKCIRKLALMLRKIPCAVKQIYRLLCPGEHKALAHSFELHCSNKEQTTYKLYSSNSSLLQIVEDTVVMFTGQTKSIGLQFRYWQNENSIRYKSSEDKRSVLLAVDDGRACTLYLYELQCQNRD